MNIHLIFKYITALAIGFAFIDIQTRLVGFSTSIPFSLNEYEWTKNYSELSLFVFNFITYLIPLALVTLIIGYLVANLLKLNNIIVVFLIALPSLILVVLSIGSITQLSFWYLEILRLLVILLSLWFVVTKYSLQVNNTNNKPIE